MKLVVPKFYKDFKCIGGACTDNCCIGWEIDNDEKTLAKYKSEEGTLGKRLKSNISEDTTPRFILNGERCPFLNSDNLCEIIIERGEKHLCDICREHPRFYNKTALGNEVGIGISCEEACRIVLSSDCYADTVSVNNAKSVTDKVDFRRDLYAVLSDRTVPYHERLERLYSDYGVSPESLEGDAWRGVLSSLEFLNESHAEYFSKYTYSKLTPKELEAPLERFLAYLVYRHCSPAKSHGELIQSLGFCFFAERLLCCTAIKHKASFDIFELARIFSEEIEYSTDNLETLMLEFLF
jgi:lysine-N-methylase